MLANVNRAFTRSVSVDGYPVVGKDRQTFIDHGSKGNDRDRIWKNRCSAVTRSRTRRARRF